MYDISRLRDITKDTHSELYRLRDKGLDVDRVSLAQTIAENLEVVKPDVTPSTRYSVSPDADADPEFEENSIGRLLEDLTQAGVLNTR